MELTIMTFNLRVNVDQDGPNAWPNRAAEAAQAILAAGASVICTQEGTYDMLRQLDGFLTDYEWLGEGREGGREGEHCAIFYRRGMYEVIRSGTFGLSEKPELLGHKSWNSNCPRICTWVKLREPGGKEWLLLNTHLDHMSEEARTNGIKLVAARLESLAYGLPAVLAGDFNDGPDSDVNRILNNSGLTDTYSVLYEQKPGITYHGFKGGETGEPIDYLFVTPGIRIEEIHVDRAQYNGRYPSDHYPVMARLHV